MRILYYDCFCGISGDMNLGALVDLGVDTDYLKNELKKLKIDEEFELKIEKKLKKGISGTKVDVVLTSKHTHKHSHDLHDHGDHSHDHATHKDEHSHDLHNEKKQHVHSSVHIDEHLEAHTHESHAHDTHLHEHTHSHEQVPKHSHTHADHAPHRNLSSITSIINSSDLKSEIKQLSIKMFMEVAKAEAKVHGKSIDEVHFHEVGATDSIVDLVGAAICLNYLNVDKIMASTIQLGGGFVNCAHGKIPVPAPATVEILKGIPVKTGLVSFETTTPTGAAILSANVDEFTDSIEFKIEKTGYGLGTKEFEIPNVLRVYLGTKSNSKNIGNFIEESKQYIIETNIDDMNPEIYNYIEEKLLQCGARDVYKTPIIMKKGRAAVKLTILYSKENEEKIMDIIFTETTSIGFRKFEVDKIVLKREFIIVNTKYGQITVKKSYYKNTIKYKAEYEECKKAAITHNVTITEVYNETEKLISTLSQ